MDRISKIKMLDFLAYDYKIEPKRLKSLYIECNTLDLDLSLNLYRVLYYDRLIDSLKNKCLSMSKPSKSCWGDPYETFLLNYKARMKDGSTVVFDSIKDKIYCQCWSTNEESEALWKVHSSPDFRSVKIKTNGTKLMEALYDTNNIFHLLSYFIGRIYYVSENFIQELLQEGLSKYFNSMAGGMPLIYSLLIKRKAFEYENEVRLIFNAPDSPDTDFSNVINLWDIKNKYFTFKIDINDLIEEIVFHPKLSEIDCNKMESEIRSTGYTGEINQSKLYTKNEIILDF